MFNQSSKYLFFDFETSGLNLLHDNYPWNLAFCVVENEKIKEEYDFYPWWQKLKISDDAARVTRFNYNNYKSKSVDPKIPLDKFEFYLYNPEYYIVGHNILGFDVYVHNFYRKCLGRKTDYSYIKRCIDTNCLSKAYKLNYNFNPQIEDFNEWQFRFSNFRKKGLKTSMKQMCSDFNIQYDENNAHAGLYDVKLNISVWNKLKFYLNL